uniref:Zinc-finger double domain protein n=1 Tax=Siphoviridae sp. ctMgg26 TaxID=2825462 RepID=A0A8S5PYZ7_9CAUD|nr:MAG TPA: zinc-finger double domain protein [Siphoviridae sp. ctMgg26]
MAEYIEMEKLWDELQHTPFYDNRDRDAMEDMALSISKEDVSPVVHGKWILRGKWLQCSQCDEKALLKETGETGGFHEYE